ncbi:MAG: 50S ribosomal protein L6 [Deltaproteobacteria bacterium]|nr:50S ribosomal protein L6 [Deltaproteobacteria bacterium]
MSRIGKLPVAIPAGVTVELSEGTTVKAKGPKGALSCTLPPLTSVTQDGKALRVARANDEQEARAMHGLARSLVNNLIQGVSAGYTRSLEIVGVGYSVEQKNGYLVFLLGYSHPIYYELPEGVSVVLDPKVKTKLTLNSASREALGAAAAIVRGFRPPEPYKGKGVKYTDEVIRRKEGKSKGR